MGQRGKIESFGVLKTATIGGIVTAAFIAVPMALFVVVMIFFRVTHHFTGWPVQRPYTVATPSTAASPIAVVQPTPVAHATAGSQPNQNVGNKQGGLLRIRDALIFSVISVIGYGIFGFIIFGFWSWLYNVLSPRFGGIEIEWTDGADK